MMASTPVPWRSADKADLNK